MCFVIRGGSARGAAAGDGGSLRSVWGPAIGQAKPWNDIVVDGRGNVHVGNVGFEFPGGEFAPGGPAA